MIKKSIFIAIIISCFFSCGTKKSDETDTDTANVETAEVPADQVEEASPENKGEIHNETKKVEKSGHEQNTLAFPDLKSISPKGYDHVFLFYDPEHTQVINEKDSAANEGEPSILLIKTKLDNKQKDIFTISFNPGPSNDPLFSILKGGKEIASFNAEELILPGNGSVYSTGHTNNFFDQRRKFQLKDNKLKEVKQPYLYVGLQTKTNNTITLYTDTDLKQTLTTLPKGTEIEVLVNNEKNYLIRTPFGLTGWWKKTSDKETPIDGLVFNGD